MGRVIQYPFGMRLGLAVSFNLTRYFALLNSDVAVSATEADRECILTPGGQITAAGFYVGAHTITTSHTVYTLRVNGADTSLVITVPAGASNRWHHSTGGPVTIAAKDRVCWKVVTPNTSGSITIQNSYFDGICDGVHAQWWFIGMRSTAGNGLTNHGVWGNGSANTVASSSTVAKVAGTVRSLSWRSGTNGRAVVDTATFMKSGATTTLEVATTASTQANVEDLVSPVTLAFDDVYAMRIVWGASAGAMASCITASFEPNGSAYPILGQLAQAIAAGGTLYFHLGGFARGWAAEADVQTYMTQPGTLSNFDVRMAANTLSVASTLTLRKNGVATGVVFTIGASSSATVSDSDTVSVVRGDLLDWEVVVPAGTGSLSSPTVNFSFTPTPSSVPFSQPPRFIRRWR